MSSHHIIRDEQEPPVFVFQMHNNWQELSEILGWSPILLVDPSLKEVFDFKKTKIDGFVYGKNGLDHNDGKSFVYHEAELGKSLLNWISSKDCTAINIFCDFRVMMDLFEELKTESVIIPFVFFTESGRYIFKPNSLFKKWYPENFGIEILNDKIKKLVNLKPESNGFTVEKAGFITIEVEENLVFLKEK